MEASLFNCCGSSKWSKVVAALGPFDDRAKLLEAARKVWWKDCNVTDWLEAFTAHPRIGDVSQLKEKFQATEELCSNEQSAAMASSTEATLQELKQWNDAYFDKHGFIFIIFATGKKAEEVLRALKQRHPNTASQELKNAAIEQMKITELRLAKLFPNLFPQDQGESSGEERKPGWVERTVKIAAHVTGVLRSPITSHVLDISSGRPAAGVPIRLERLMQCSEDAWDLVGEDVTNDDGRSGKLMEPSSFVASGVYRISFDTREYETTMCGGKLGFYPNASIVFEILDSQTHQHFHVPLLYSPFGYSTYRGS